MYVVLCEEEEEKVEILFEYNEEYDYD